MNRATWAAVSIHPLPGGDYAIVVGGHTVRQFESIVMARHFLDTCEPPNLREIGPLLDEVLAHAEVRQIPPLSDHPCGALVDYLRAALRTWLDLAEANGDG